MYRSPPCGTNLKHIYVAPRRALVAHTNRSEHLKAHILVALVDAQHTRRVILT
jgi:hypothetical protein